MQSIQTKFFGPTNNKGSRYKATCERGSITVYAGYSLTPERNHIEAAKALILKFNDEDRKAGIEPKPGVGWNCNFVSGSLPDGTMVHVFMPNARSYTRVDPDI